MGSDQHCPEEAPARRVKVDGVLMDRDVLTNGEFRNFVEATGHVTLPEEPPDAADYPGAKLELLARSSVVFRKAAGPVDLRNTHNWWTYVAGADWRHPRGPRQLAARLMEAPGRARGIEGGLVSVRSERLPPLPARRTHAAADRHGDVPSWRGLVALARSGRSSAGHLAFQAVDRRPAGWPTAGVRAGETRPRVRGRDAEGGLE